MSPAPRLFLIAAAASVVGCQEYKVDELKDPLTSAATIEVTPSTLDFGGVARGETGLQTVTISSVGGEALELGTIRLEAPGAFTVLSAPEFALLPPGESAEMEVQYTPANTQDSGDIFIASNDASRPEAVVHLSGAGLIPVLQFDPPALDLGYAAVGETAEGSIGIVNAGGETLDVSSVAVIGEGFSADPIPPFSLEPGERTEVDIVFAPMLDANYAGEIWAESNSPAGSTKADLTATSLETPVAVCDVSPAEAYALYDTVSWLGSASYDPGGGEITGYEWALVSKPDGSSVSMPAGGADRDGMVPDVVGLYTAELVVTNDSGDQSEPCRVTMEAIPSQDLWVEMYWDVPQDDMDLHLLAPGGSLRTGTDCYYANCVGRGLSWGPGGVEDDPSLDIDDIPGTGPENINIADPEDDVYTVYVHDYMGSTPDYYDTNNVTVNVYLSGELVWSGTKGISGDDDYVPFAAIDVASNSVSSL